MDNNITFKIQETLAPKDQEYEEEEEEEEETLSLCDFPLNSNESKTDHHRRRSSSQLPDFFEFFNDFSESNMSHAEDIISGGKLVPYRQSPPLSDDRIINSVPGDEFNSEHLSRRYCDSLPEMMIPTRSNSASAAAEAAAATKLTRSSRSLDCRKLRRNSSLVMKSEASDIHRNLLSDGSVKSEGFKGLSRPSRWYSLMFGPVKFPPEMDLRDMKNRQVRRKVTAVDAGVKSPANRSDRRSSSSWGYDLLSALSCKNRASVAVKASSVGFVPQV